MIQNPFCQPQSVSSQSVNSCGKSHLCFFCSLHISESVCSGCTSPSALCDHLRFVPFQTREKSKTEHFTKQLETESKMEKSIHDNCWWMTSALEWKIKIKMWTWLNERIWISSVQCFSCCISLVCIFNFFLLKERAKHSLSNVAVFVQERPRLSFNACFHSHKPHCQLNTHVYPSSSGWDVARSAGQLRHSTSEFYFIRWSGVWSGLRLTGSPRSVIEAGGDNDEDGGKWSASGQSLLLLLSM